MRLSVRLSVLLALAWALAQTATTRPANHPAAPLPPASAEPNRPPPAPEPNWPRPRSDERRTERNRMVETIRDEYGLADRPVLDALNAVPRHWFVPPNQQSLAYADLPLPIGYDQTISQPFIVAYMTSLLHLTPTSKVLEIGAGSGYQAAVLSEFTPHVFTIEILEPLASTAARRLRDRGYRTVRVRCGDGYQGWPEHAPFDAIIVTCAPDHVPQPLLDQLKPGGRLCIPLGSAQTIQSLTLLTKDTQGNISRRTLSPVRFVPLTRPADSKK